MYEARASGLGGEKVQKSSESSLHARILELTPDLGPYIRNSLLKYEKVDFLVAQKGSFSGFQASSQKGVV